MTSQNLNELDVDNVVFNNDWNLLPPNGNTIPPSTRSTLTLPDQDDSTDDEGTKNINLVVSTTVLSPTRTSYYNPYNNTVVTRTTPTIRPYFNPFRTTSISPIIKPAVASPARPADFNRYRTTTTIDYAESLAKKISTGNAGVKWTDQEKVAK